MAAWLCLCVTSALAQTPSQKEIGSEAAQAQERRALEREAEQQRRLQPQPDVRLPTAQPVAGAAPLPRDETPCFVIRRVSLSGLSGAIEPAFDWLPAVLAGMDGSDPPEGLCLGARGVAQLIDRAQQALVERGFVTTRVFAPPQDLSGGDLALQVLPGRIRGIRFADPVSTRATAHGAMPMGPGDILNLRDIEQALENFKRVPTADASIEIVPADGPQDGPGLSDLIITWRQDQLFRVSLGLDDGGSRATGRYLTGLTVSYDHALTLNDLFYLTLQRDLGGGDAGHRGTRGATAHYSLPLGYWLLGFNTSRQRYFQTVPGPWQDTVYSGWSAQQDIRLSRLIHRDADSKTTLSFKAFARQSSNYVEDLEILDQRRRVGGWELGLGHRTYLGDAVLDLNLAYKRGTGAFGSKPAVEEAFGEGTSRFQLTTLDAGLQLPFDLAGRAWRYSGNLRAQAHHTPLTPQDRFAIGGRYTVRGFDGELSLSGDSGWLVRNEISTALGESGASIYAGLDHGEVRGPSSAFLIGRRLTGAVLGLRGSVGRTQYEFFVGTPVRKPQGFRTSNTTAGFQLYWQLL
jgi:hemolysin activation/secretion protein